MTAFLKKLIIAILVLFILSIGFIAYLLSNKAVLITPYTYSVNEKYNKDIKIAESSDILIVGDRMGLYLNQFLGPLKDDLKSEYKFEPKIYNWSRENEGLHRTINKIKKLKKLPSIIIYHGASSEWYETKFNSKEKEKILYNFSKFSNDKIISLIISFPDVSRLIYKKVQLYELLSLDKRLRPRLESDFDTKELEYLYYHQELKDFVDYIKQNKSNLILITDPINIITPPKEACPITSTNSIVEYQQEIENLLKEENFKVAYAKARELAVESISNAKTYYLLGMAAKSISEFKIAREALTNANIYDCYNWRGNGIYNSIIRREALNFQVELIDFEQELTNIQLQSDNVFFDDIYPQNLYYNNLVQELTVSIKKYFNLKKL